eukprot:COSAG05_NODE_4516_length_1481_cov_2.200434_3_plen_172_part_01
MTPFEEEDHNAAFIIQTRYRKYASRKGFNDTLAVLSRQAIESHISGSPPASPRWPEPVTKLQQRRRRVWVTCSDPSSSPFAFLVAVVILVAIIFSCSVFVLETLPDLYGRHQDLLFWMEFSCVVIFTVEFVVRIWSCPSLQLFRSDFLNWVDLAAIAPFYLELALPAGAGAK